ncbi:MAG: hypothetical protein ABIN95_04540 [Mucilaginibacter sp.]
MDYFEKIELVDKIHDSLPDFNIARSLFTHTVLSSIDIDWLIVTYLSGQPMMTVMQSNMFKRLSAYSVPNNLFETLIEKVPVSSFKERTRIRILLEALLPRLKEEQKQRFFYVFFNSLYRNDNKAAFRMCHQIWNEQFEKSMLDKFFESKSLWLIEIIIKNSDTKMLSEIAQEIWFDLDSTLKYKIIKRVAVTSPSTFDFLQHIDSQQYLYVISNFNLRKTITDEYASNCLKTADKKNMPFVLLSLSKLNKWHIIEKTILDIRFIDYLYYDPYE